MSAHRSIRTATSGLAATLGTTASLLLFSAAAFAVQPPSTPPVIGAQTAQFINEHSALIESEINAEGLETTYEVQYGTNTTYGSSTPGPVTLAPFTSMHGTITSLTGLSPGTTYHYRIVASNQAGTTPGPDKTFTTTGAPQTGTFTPFTIPTVPLTTTTPVTFPNPGPTAKITPKKLTNKQKLANALKACAKKRKSERAACRRAAHMKYGPVKAKNKTKPKKK